MRPLTAILAALTGIAGWYYLFYSNAARRLESIEHRQANRRRVIYRKVNGLIMLVLAVLLYLGTYAVDERLHPAFFASTWLTVVVLLGAIVSLVLADIRLTMRLQRNIVAAAGSAADRRQRESRDRESRIQR